MSQRREVRLNLETERPPSTGGTVVAFGILLAICVAVRFYVYSDPPHMGPERYEKPVETRLYHLDPRDKEFPAGYEPVESEARVVSVSLEEALAPLPEASRPKVPSPEKVARTQVSTYLDDNRARAWVVAVEYRDAEAPQEAGAALRQDRALVFVIREGGRPTGQLAEAVRLKGARMKKLTVQLEKMKTLGNAYIQFGIDVVVGLLFALFALFLTKYFLVMRQIEQF